MSELRDTLGMWRGQLPGRVSLPDSAAVPPVLGQWRRRAATQERESTTEEGRWTVRGVYDRPANLPRPRSLDLAAPGPNCRIILRICMDCLRICFTPCSKRSAAAARLRPFRPSGPLAPKRGNDGSLYPACKCAAPHARASVRPSARRTSDSRRSSVLLSILAPVPRHVAPSGPG